MTDDNAAHRSGPPIILHIGPHKTGTTTLQSGLGQNRARLRDQGVIYPGSLVHELNAATAVATGRVDPGKDLQFATDRWFGMRDAINSSGARMGILSSEFYSETPPERIGWLTEQLGPDFHVVITLRPLAKIVPSQWQQFLQNQLTMSWDDWLTAVLEKPEPGKVTPSFWRRHRHDLLVRRWLEVVGPDRLTVIAADDKDPEFVLRSFEELLSVEPGTLTPTELRANRSLSLEEAELVRCFNQLYRTSGLQAVDYTTLIRYGAIRFLQRRPIAADDHRILLPGWASDRIAELSRMMVDDIAASGVRVIGPLQNLADQAMMPKPGENPAVTTVRPELAADLAAGVVDTMGSYRPVRPPAPDAAPIATKVLRENAERDAGRQRGERQRLQRELAEIVRLTDAQQLITEANRADVLRELIKRLAARLRRLRRPRR